MKTHAEIETKTTSSASANNLTKLKSVPLKVPALQTRLEIGKPGDKYEQEADRVADMVMSMPEPSLQRQPIEEEEEMIQPKPILQLQPMEEEEEEIMPRLQMQPMEEEEEMLQAKSMIHLQPLEEEEEELMPKLQMQPLEEEEEMLQAKPMFQFQPVEEEEEMLQPKLIQKAGCSSCEEMDMQMKPGPEFIQRSPLSHIESCGGTALPDSTRGFFESRMGYNFGNVRVHTCDSAVQMNQQLGAQAFTYGNNIFFNEGKFDPVTTGGKKLLAHELTHVVQQNGGMKRLDRKKASPIQVFRAEKNFQRQKLSKAPRIIQRAAPAAIAAALALRCAIGAVVGMLIDWGIQYGISRWRGQEYRHDWCGTILSGILGCLGGMSAAGVEAYMARVGARVVVGGPLIGRILTWLVAQTSVFFPRQSALMLLRLGCINEDQHEAITE